MWENTERTQNAPVHMTRIRGHALCGKMQNAPTTHPSICHPWLVHKVRKMLRKQTMGTPVCDMAASSDRFRFTINTFPTITGSRGKQLSYLLPSLSRMADLTEIARAQGLLDAHDMDHGWLTA